MNFDEIIGQTFLEQTFFELLHFDLQERFDAYANTHMHIYFKRLQNAEIEITEVRRFTDVFAMDKVDRANVEKIEWFEISSYENRRIVLLVRLDRSGYLGTNYRDGRPRVEKWCLGWADECVNESGEPLTREQIRKAFEELKTYIEEQVRFQNSRKVKAV